MEYSDLPALIVQEALIPFFRVVGSKALEEVGKRTGGEAFDCRKAIVAKVRDLFRPDELTYLNLLSESPNNERIQGRLEGQLEEKLAGRPDIVSELMEQLKTLRGLPPATIVNQVGDDNTAVQNSENSIIIINK